MSLEKEEDIWFPLDKALEYERKKAILEEAIKQETLACIAIAEDIYKRYNSSGDYGAAYASVAAHHIINAIRTRLK